MWNSELNKVRIYICSSVINSIDHPILLEAVCCVIHHLGEKINMSYYMGKTKKKKGNKKDQPTSY